MRVKTLNTGDITIETLNCKEELVDLLYFLYKNDVVFPRSCSSVSMPMALILYKTNIKDDYMVKYIRGHFRNDNEQEECYCDIVELDFDRFSNIEDFECTNCNCEYMVAHSWIELTNKTTEDTIILDFTSIQFEEDFCDYHPEILQSSFNKEELFDYLYKRSKFIVFPNESVYKNYIKSGNELDGEHISNTVDNLISTNSDSDLTILLENINYSIG